MFDGFDFSPGFGDAGGSHQPEGCVWHIIFICFATVLLIGFLKWMS